MYPVSRDHQVKFRPEWNWRDLILLVAVLTLLFGIIRTATQLEGDDDSDLPLEASRYVLHAVMLTGVLNWAQWQQVIIGAILTALRVLTVLVLSLAWAVPVGVAIGRNSGLAQISQPLVQIAASIPATALFAVLLLALTQIGGGLQIGSIILMMLGTMWYLLFNVIAGAQSIPSDLFEATRVYKLSTWQRWQTVILPGIFPYLITGIITAVGGAWNASIVSEYIEFQGRVVETSLFGCNDFSIDGNREFFLAFSSYCCDVSSNSSHQPPSLVSSLSLNSRQISVNCIKGYL